MQLYLIWKFNRSKRAQPQKLVKTGVYPIKNQAAPTEQPKPTDFTSISPGVTHLTEKHDEQALAQED
jgi:hypothetical protein